MLTDSTGNPQRLILWRRDVAQLLGISMRTLNRMVSSSDIPTRDLSIRGRKGWKASTIYRWVDEGCPSKSPIKR